MVGGGGEALIRLVSYKQWVVGGGGDSDETPFVWRAVGERGGGA